MVTSSARSRWGLPFDIALPPKTDMAAISLEGAGIFAFAIKKAWKREIYRLAIQLS